MTIGHVNTDYVLFILKDDDPEALMEKVDEMAWAIKMEAKMISELQGDMWDF